MRHCVVLFLIILVIACIQFHSPEDHPWVYQTCGSATLAPIVRGDRIYIFSSDKNLYCLNAATGGLLWKTELTEWIVDSLIEGDTTILVKDTRTLYSFDLISGEKLWELSFEEGIDSIVAEKDIFMTTCDNFFRIKERTGAIVWKATFPESTIGDRCLYSFKDRLFVEEARNVLACYSTDGEKLWEFRGQSQYTLTPWIFFEDDTLLLVFGEVYRLDIDTGVQLWVVEIPDMLSHPIRTETNLILSNLDRILCVDCKTAQILWEKSAEDIDFKYEFVGVYGERLHLQAYADLSPPRRALIVREWNGEPILKVDSKIFAAASSGDKVVFSTFDELFCFDVLSGKSLWSFHAPFCFYRGITIENERAYIAGDDGKVYSFPLDGQALFFAPVERVEYSEELGRIKSIFIEYFCGYYFGIFKGEVSIVLQDGEYYVTDGYGEEFSSCVDEKKNFKGETISKEVVEAFYESITDLYLDSEYWEFASTSTAHIIVKIELETGELIELKSGSDLYSLVPWEVEFRGRKAVQYSGAMSVAFDDLMKEVGWNYNMFCYFSSWGVVMSGLCQKPVNLLEIEFDPT
jgi:outer membrane protein assembly factor BamB